MDDASFQHDVVHSNVNDAIEAIEGELGTNPKGAQATVKDRLNLMARVDGRSVIGWPTGRYATNNFLFGSTAASQTLSANTVYYTPWRCPQSVTIDRIAIEISTGAAGNARIGIYNSLSSDYPGTLLLDAGTVDTTAAAVKELTISQALTGGVLYWLALHPSAGPQARGAAGGGILTMTRADTVSGFGMARIYESYAYASGLPTTATTTPTDGSDTAYPPVFWMRRA